MKISVIIPIYNTLDCLERCVASVRAQTYKDLEIILVDDGSTDGSGSLADRLAEADERTFVYHKENGGSSSARNYGLKYAQGDFIGFVDSDDYIDEGMYDKLANMALAESLSMVQISRNEIAPDGSRLPDVCIPPEENSIIGAEEFIKELLLHKGDSSFCTKLTDKSLFENRSFPEGELNEDFRLLIDMLLETDRVGILRDRGYNVYYRKGSNTRPKGKDEFPRVFTDIVVNANRMEKLLPKHFPQLVPYTVRFALVQRLDYMLHIPVSMMNGKNDFYMDVKRYLRLRKGDIRSNPYLNPDQRRKLILLATAPRFVRQIHRINMKLRGKI